MQALVLFEICFISVLAEPHPVILGFQHSIGPWPYMFTYCSHKVCGLYFGSRCGHVASTVSANAPP